MYFSSGQKNKSEQNIIRFKMMHHMKTVLDFTHTEQCTYTSDAIILSSGIQNLVYRTINFCFSESWREEKQY